ncbi:MAG: formylglycine-generating enzyme family protein [Verrucomicrobia bacterium]|nr:MAG: formylglycine-generating enzyme family protein [Verrucomicrobiota bacterium]
MDEGNHPWAGGCRLLFAGGLLLALHLAAQPLELQLPLGAETVAIRHQVPPNQRAILWTSSDLVTWEPRYAFVSDGGREPVHLPAEASWGFVRLEVRAFTVPPGLVWIRPGVFLMGSDPYEQGHNPDEGPVHEVRIDKGFWMGATEVTVRQFTDVMRYNPLPQGTDPREPIRRITVGEAEEYCRRLTARHRELGLIPPGTAYRLPSEAEWEYACRAGTTTRYSWGDDPDYQLMPRYAWCRLNCGGPQPVGQLLPNPWGLYDMHGNVFEWCLGWYAPYPGGERLGTDKLRNPRGGSYYCPLDYLRSASRHPDADLPSDLIGFRVVLAAECETVLPLQQVAIPEVTLHWAEDGTWVEIDATTTTPEATCHLETNGWKPSPSSPTPPVRLKQPATVRIAAFRPNWTRSEEVQVEIRRLPPPRIETERGALVLLHDDPAAVIEYQWPEEGVWRFYPGALPVPADTPLRARARKPGWLTSVVVRHNAP